jgi:hypothetical protein
MPDDGDANVFEIVSSQLGQDLGVNLVLPERLLIALQTKISQPSRDVHDVPSAIVIAERKLAEWRIEGHQSVCCRDLPARGQNAPIPPLSFQLRVTTSRSKPPHDRSAVRPEADTMNQTVRSRFTPPERDSFKPAPLRASSNSLNDLASNIRTKMAVVRLRQRKGPKRGRKWPKMGFGGCPRGSDKWPEKPTFCGFPTADQEPKKNIPNGQTGGGKLTRRKHSFRWGALKHHAVTFGSRGA